MKRQMKASAVALLISGCLLALSAGAAGPKPSAAEQKSAAELKLVESAKAKEAAQCVDCRVRADKVTGACSQACPMNDPSKKEATVRCLNKCSDKYKAAMAACSGPCAKVAPRSDADPAPAKKTQ